MAEKDWSCYYEITQNKPPSKLLVKALSYVENRDRAFDIGAGALKDSKYLLAQGFDVLAIDSSEDAGKRARDIISDKFHFRAVSFIDFEFPKDVFDIVSAQFSLPFSSSQNFDEVFVNIKDSMVKGGIFCGQLFGIKDAWSSRPYMTFHTKEQAEKLLEGMEVISFKEEEEDSTTADGTPKHWHVFHVIARKK